MSNSRPTSQSAQQRLAKARLELARREQTRRRQQRLRFPDAATMAEKLSGGRWRRARHLELLNAKLREMQDAGGGFLLVDMPPRHGKSEFISHWFIVSYLDENPQDEVILASYGKALGARWGRKARNTIQEHQAQLRVRISKDSSSVTDWSTTAGGGMVSAGVGGPIMGRGAKLLIIDDPFKNRQDANSQTIRETVWDWWTSTAFTRLAPGAIVVILHTRWHEDDLIGRLLRPSEDENAIQWEHLHLPAIAEEDDALGRAPGEALWPERFNEEALAHIRAAIGSRDWYALYQGRPTPAEGVIFKRAWFNQRWRELPARFDRMLQSWDMTFDDTEGSDYVVGYVLGEVGADIYVCDEVRGQMDFPSTCNAVIALSSKWPAAQLKLVEKKANGPAVIKALKRKISGLVAVEPEGSKPERASASTPSWEAGNVWIPESASWTNDFVEEHVAFPAGKNDDRVDASSQGINRLRSTAIPQAAGVGDLADKKPLAQPPASNPIRRPTPVRATNSLLGSGGILNRRP